MVTAGQESSLRQPLSHWEPGLLPPGGCVPFCGGWSPSRPSCCDTHHLKLILHQTAQLEPQHHVTPQAPLLLQMCCVPCSGAVPRSSAHRGEGANGTAAHGEPLLLHR